VDSTITGVTLENATKIFGGVLTALEEDPEQFAFLKEGSAGNPITLGARVIDPSEWAKKQIDRAKASGDEWLKRVMKPRKLPTDAAIAADGKRKDRLAESERQNKWLNKMKKVDVDEMYRTIQAVGSQGFVNGVAAREHKITRVVNELQPMVAAAAATIDAMPQATDADREKRLIAARRLMIEIGKRRAGVA
jgi:hypothetical protein